MGENVNYGPTQFTLQQVTGYSVTEKYTYIYIYIYIYILPEWRSIGCRKRFSLKNWKGREEGEDPGKDRKRK